MHRVPGWVTFFFAFLLRSLGISGRELFCMETPLYLMREWTSGFREGSSAIGEADSQTALWKGLGPSSHFGDFALIP